MVRARAHGEGGQEGGRPGEKGSMKPERGQCRWLVDRIVLAHRRLQVWKLPRRLPLPGDQRGKIEMSAPSGKEISVWNIWENSKRDAIRVSPSRVGGGGAGFSARRTTGRSAPHSPAAAVFSQTRNRISANLSFVICKREIVV